MLTENAKYRYQQLAGVLQEEIKLISSNQGRSDVGTLGFYVEQYLLDITSKILNAIKNKFGGIEITPNSTKISENTLVVKFKVKNNDFLLTSIVSFEQNANTSTSITSSGKTEKFNLNSKHSQNDIELFIQEILSRM